MSQSTSCVLCGEPAYRRGTSGCFPKFCGKTCQRRAAYQRNKSKALAVRPEPKCEFCGGPLSGGRSDRKFCCGACQSKHNRRARGVVVENTSRCSSCLEPLIGRRSSATICLARKCMRWASRHPGVPHPSTQPRACAVCGVPIDHRNGKAKYCGKLCVNAAVVERHRDEMNARRRAAWEDPASTRKQTQKAYQQANVDRYRRWARESRIKHPERHRAYYTEWLAADPANYQRILLNQHKRRSRLLEHPDYGVVVLAERDWKRLVQRYRNCCAYCGKLVERPVIEHIIPVVRGGRHSIGNVLPACRECNSSKHASFIVEWRKRRPDAGPLLRPPLAA
jgi:hypothetical protein